jgi:hypothetical protein
MNSHQYATDSRQPWPDSRHPQAASAADKYSNPDEHDDELVEGAGIVISVAIGLALWAAIAIVVFIVSA